MYKFEVGDSVGYLGSGHDELRGRSWIITDRQLSPDSNDNRYRLDMKNYRVNESDLFIWPYKTSQIQVNIPTSGIAIQRDEATKPDYTTIQTFWDKGYMDKMIELINKQYSTDSITLDKECSHKWKTIELFTSSIVECELCGMERKND